MKGSNRRERAAKKEKEKEGELAKDGPSSPKREDDARAQGGPAAALHPGVISAPTIFQREAKQAPPRGSQQAPPTDAILGALAPADANPPASTHCGHGRRCRGRGRGGNRGRAPRLWIRESSAPLYSKCDQKYPILQAGMTLINFPKGCHPRSPILGDVLFVPIMLSLASLSTFPLGWRFCLAPGMRRCRCDTLTIVPVGTGLRSFRARPYLNEGYKREITVQDYKIRQSGMGLFR